VEDFENTILDSSAGRNSERGVLQTHAELGIYQTTVRSYVSVLKSKFQCLLELIGGIVNEGYS
jgi:hypothetical protein